MYKYSPDQHELLTSQVYQDYYTNDADIPEFEILSTIRYDPKLTSPAPKGPEDIKEANLFLFPEHYHRLKNTTEFFLKGNSLDLSSDLLLQKLTQAIKDSGIDVATPLKIRLLVSLNGTINIELYETSIRENLLDGLKDDFPSDQILDAYIDEETLMISPFTSFKTTNRAHYSASRQRCLPGKRAGKEEVLVFNTQNMLMEGSITNVAIKDKKTGHWVTPPLGSGCLCGVVRHFLLMKDYIKELPISRNMVQSGDEIMLFNGIMGVVKAKVV